MKCVISRMSLWLIVALSTIMVQPCSIEDLLSGRGCELPGEYRRIEPIERMKKQSSPLKTPSTKSLTKAATVTTTQNQSAADMEQSESGLTFVMPDCAGNITANILVTYTDISIHLERGHCPSCSPHKPCPEIACSRSRMVRQEITHKQEKQFTLTAENNKYYMKLTDQITSLSLELLMDDSVKVTFEIPVSNLKPGSSIELPYPVVKIR